MRIELRDPWLTRFARCAVDDVHSFRVQVAVTRFSRVRRLQIFNFVESQDCIIGAAARPNTTEET
jgi:hypothetical protein